MSKRHIAVLLLYETLLAAAVSLALGLFLGVALSKLAELCLLRLLNGSVSFRMTVPPGTLLSTAGIFGVIFALLYLNSLWRLFRSSTLSPIIWPSPFRTPSKRWRCFLWRSSW